MGERLLGRRFLRVGELRAGLERVPSGAHKIH